MMPPATRPTLYFIFCKAFTTLPAEKRCSSTENSRVTKNKSCPGPETMPYKKEVRHKADCPKTDIWRRNTNTSTAANRRKGGRGGQWQSGLRTFHCRTIRCFGHAAYVRILIHRCGSDNGEVLRHGDRSLPLQGSAKASPFKIAQKFIILQYD